MGKASKVLRLGRGDVGGQMTVEVHHFSAAQCHCKTVTLGVVLGHPGPPSSVHFCPPELFSSGTSSLTIPSLEVPQKENIASPLL